MLKKELEKLCFDTTVQYVEKNLNDRCRKYISSVFPISGQCIQSERPDFIINNAECSYAIEHFAIDFCNDGENNNQSQSKRAGRDIHDLYLKYHDNDIGTIRTENIPDAVADIENEINKLANLSSSFDYCRFVEATQRVFLKHYNKISEYLHNPNISNIKTKIGFLIEFHNDSTLIRGMYNGSEVKFSGNRRSFPMTEDIVNLFAQSIDLDFIIISQYDEGVLIEPKDVKLYEPKNLRKSIELQKVKVCDKVFYPKINKNIIMKLMDRQID